jgi:hypothetical protein
MTDAKATVRSAVIEGITKHCLETGLRMGATTDLLIEDLIKAVFDKPVRWAVIAYADECDTEEVG